MNLRNQHHHIAKLQRQWAAMAGRDAQYNMDRYRSELHAGNRTLAAGYLQEARWDLFWRNRRLAIARKNSK